MYSAYRPSWMLSRIVDVAVFALATGLTAREATTRTHSAAPKNSTRRLALRRASSGGDDQ